VRGECKRAYRGGRCPVVNYIGHTATAVRSLGNARRSTPHMSLLLVLFVAGSILFAVLLLLGAGDLVSLSPLLSVVIVYLLLFSLVAVVATTLLEVISALAPGGAP
jgi:voltage-gated potassium channel Kch